MSEVLNTALPISAGALKLIESAKQAQSDAEHTELHAAHWLEALLSRHAAMAEALSPGLEAATAQSELEGRLQKGELGAALPVPEAIHQAHENAAARGQAKVRETDLAAVILQADGYTVAANTTSAFPGTGGSQRRHEHPSSAAEPAAAFAAGYRPRPVHATPMLDSMGRDLTREAANGQLTPVVGRDDEMQLLIETLCRRTKRNPALVGPAGVGKTSVVEGLALRIVRGEVPNLLRGARLLAIQPSALVAGAGAYGELDERMQAILEEASQDGILIFIDEVHSIVGAGGREGSSDIASQLKPALARGEIACIAATTDDEYRRFIEIDSALERRFQPIRIQEMTPDQTLGILKVLRDEAAASRGVLIDDEVLVWLVDFAGRFLRNRTFPDKGVDLLEQCIAHASMLDATQVEVADAEAVAGRMVGMPADAGAQIDVLKQKLTQSALFHADDAEALAARLQVTMRGLDLRASRPNAVLLVAGEAEPFAEELADTIGQALFGTERVISLDCGHFLQEHDIASLIGAPPGYVGYTQSLAIHRIAQTPWCVLHCANVHAAHPHIRAVLTQALEDGYFTDTSGKRIFLSDTVVILSAGIETLKVASVGFRNSRPDGKSAGQVRALMENALGAALVQQTDLVLARSPRCEKGAGAWAQRQVLDELVQRYHKHGLELHCDSSLVDWLAANGEDNSEARWERMVDERISPLLIPHLGGRGKKSTPLLLRFENGALQVESYAPETAVNE